MPTRAAGAASAQRRFVSVGLLIVLAIVGGLVLLSPLSADARSLAEPPQLSPSQLRADSPLLTDTPMSTPTTTPLFTSTYTWTPAPSATPTGTFTPTPTNTPTAVPTGSCYCWVYPTGSSTTCNLPDSYDYNFTFRVDCTQGFNDRERVEFNVAPDPSGPWTVYDQIEGGSSFSPGPASRGG